MTKHPHTSGLALVAAAVLLASGCASGTSTSEPDSAPTKPGKYEQTWPKSYLATTCGEWNTVMDGQQRFAAAADMLAGARSRDGGKTLPPDALMRRFQADIQKSCEPIASMKLAEIGGTLYLIGRATYRP